MTTRLPASLRARLALGISTSTMARSRRSRVELAVGERNGRSGRFGPAGSGGGTVTFVLVVLLGGLTRIRRPKYDPCRRSSDDEAAGPGRAARPFSLSQKKRTGGEGASDRWVSTERLSHHRIMREVSLFEGSHGGAHADIKDGRRPGPAFSGQKPMLAFMGRRASSSRLSSQRLAYADKRRTGFWPEIRTRLAPPRANGTN
jgi:hypothetical protein